MAFRNSPSTQSTEYSPFSMVFGKEMNLPFDASVLPKDNLSKDAKHHLEEIISNLKITQDLAAENIKLKQAKMKERYDKNIKIPEFRLRDKDLEHRYIKHFSRIYYAMEIAEHALARSEHFRECYSKETDTVKEVHVIKDNYHELLKRVINNEIKIEDLKSREDQLKHELENVKKYMTCQLEELNDITIDNHDKLNDTKAALMKTMISFSQSLKLLNETMQELSHRQPEKLQCEENQTECNCTGSYVYHVINIVLILGELIIIHRY
ncbi:unnamed protein product [Mytilus edulis]|uniref:Uncharacterized protein n=1 Tax=Mytilus edulis TaxID=6550 RepID=A0A8S3SSD9_MYTED|nr:unnamed protein product [Mytilus edulis]